jgi:hypothetical protein
MAPEDLPRLAFGRCPGFVLMMTTILALVEVSVLAVIVIGRTAIDGLNALANP